MLAWAALGDAQPLRPSPVAVAVNEWLVVVCVCVCLAPSVPESAR
jgi:hypothetical protein